MNSQLHQPASTWDETGPEFILWALATLNMPAEQKEGVGLVVQIPPEHQSALGGTETLSFCFDSPRHGRADEAPCLTPRSRLFRWIVQQLQQPGSIQHAAPVGQPSRIKEIAERIFAAYRVPGGSVHLSGCTLEDQPFLRLSYLEAANENGAPLHFTHRFFTNDSKEADSRLIKSLGADRLEPTVPQRRIPFAELGRWLAAVEATGGRDPAGSPGSGQRVAATVVWCKYTAGKVGFAIGEAKAEVHFSAWARQLIEGTAKPPPFRCPETGLQSYELAATDDGRISVPEAVGVCAQTGRRVLKHELRTCQVTGKRVLPETLGCCPVTRQRLLGCEMVECSMCGQQVTPVAIKSGRCAACRALKPVSKDDPRMACLFGRYPKLDRWSGWRIAETASAYILTATALLRKLLVVVEKESLELLRLALGSRFSRRWHDAPPADRDYLTKLR